jgi:hypothetical protein
VTSFPSQLDRALLATPFTNFHLEHASPLFPGDENSVASFVVRDTVHDTSNVVLYFLQPGKIDPTENFSGEFIDSRHALFF